MSTSSVIYKRVHDRLQFVLILVFFFPTVIQAMFNLAGSEEADASKIILGWGLIIAMLVATYLFLESFQEHFRSRFLKLIDGLLLVYIALFVPVFLILSYLASQGEISTIYSYPLGISLAGMVFLPILLILILTAYAYFKEILWIKDEFFEKKVSTNLDESHGVASPPGHSPESTSSSDQL